MSKDLIDIDLDDVIRHIVKVKLNGKVIEVEAPDLMQLLQLVSAGNKLKALDGATDDEARAAFDTFGKEFKILFPELKEEKLSLVQLQTLLEMMIFAAMPSEAKELKKHGITPDTLYQKKSE